MRIAAQKIANGPEFNDRAEVRAIEWSLERSCVRSVCVPLRNEAELLSGHCEALGIAIKNTLGATRVVYVANDTTDKSLSLAKMWAQALEIDYVLVDLALDKAISTASHSRRFAMDLAAQFSPHGYILTTDADTQVASNWIAENEAALTRSGGLVYGDVALSAADIRAMTASQRECSTAEGQYVSGLRELWCKWTADTAPDIFIYASGASLAISVRDYLAVGRLPTPRAGEDRALAIACVRHGLPVTRGARVQVETSARTDARAPGGMGDALREQSIMADPFCDKMLIPLVSLRQHADRWNAGLRSGGSSDFFFDTLAAERANSSHRMRLSEMKLELARARQLLSEPPEALDANQLL